MATASIPNTFINGQNADANDVNANFSYIMNWLNTNVIQPDLANFSVFPTLPTSNPTNAYHATHKNYVDLWLPAGSIMQYGGITAPSGWLLCDGATYDGANPVYSRLYGAIGTNFGGAGINAFQVPDLKGRVPVGLGAGAGLTPRTINSKGGNETHRLTAAESGNPALSHTVNDAGHSHGQIASYGGPFTGTATVLLDASTGGGLDTLPYGYARTTAEATGISINGHAAFDAANAHNNMQPFTVVNYLIRL